MEYLRAESIVHDLTFRIQCEYKSLVYSIEGTDSTG